MSQDTHIQIRVSEDDKAESRKIFDSMGLTFSGAIKLFLKKTIQEKKLPFSVTADLKAKKTVSSKKSKLEKPAKKAETASEWNSFTKRRIGL